MKVQIVLDDRVKRTLRLPETLNDRLEQEARQNGCSVNAEIVRRLRASLEGYRQ